MATNLHVKQLYKSLLYLGKDYPSGYEFFRERCHRAFMKNRDVSDPKKIKDLLKFGEYISKELEALYKLKKYRTLKRLYYNDDDWVASYELKLRKINKEGGDN